MRHILTLMPLIIILLHSPVKANVVSACKLEESISEEGGYRQISVGSHRLLDVDSFKVLDNHIFYATSPIYRKPEVGVVDCKNDKLIVLVVPKSKSKEYPDGSDYFRLKDVSKDEKKGNYNIRYYSIFDVDGKNFKILENAKNLKSVRFLKQSL